MIRKLTIVLLVMVAQICVATPYHNVRLSKIANAVGVNLPDTIGKNTNNDTLYTFKGKPLRIRTNAFGDVCHIGYKLFHNELMAAYGESPAFDFLERYLLELDLLLDGKTLQQRLDVDNVVITKGNINMLRMVNENCPFSIQYIKRRGYRVTWTVKGKPVTVAFQADCQLIKGCNMIEMDSLLVRDLPKHHSLDNQTILKGWENAKVSTSQDARILDNGNYLSNLISSKLYFRTVNGKEELVCSKGSVAKSINNIMLTGIFRNAISLRLAVDKYGYQTDSLLVTLQQFVSFCRAEGAKIYMGIKTVSQKELSGTLFILNEPLAYNHVLSFRFPICLLQGKDDVVDAKLYPYIPLQNIVEKYFTDNIKDEYKYEIK